MVEVLKSSQHERLVLLGEKIEEFKNSLKEFERSLEEEYSLADMSGAESVADSNSAMEEEVNEERLVEERFRKYTKSFPHSGGLYVKRDYIKGKGYYVKSVHVTLSLIHMVGWTRDEFIMESALSR